VPCKALTEFDNGNCPIRLALLTFDNLVFKANIIDDKKGMAGHC